MGLSLSSKINTIMKNNKLLDYKEKSHQIRSLVEFEKWLYVLGHLADCDVSVRSPQHKVEHCDITVWITGDQLTDGTWIFRYDSLSTKNLGLLKYLVDCCNGSHTSDIDAMSFSSFVDFIKFLPKDKQKNANLIFNKIKYIVSSS